MQKLSRHSQISHVAEFGVKTRRLSSRFRLVLEYLTSFLQIKSTKTSVANLGPLILVGDTKGRFYSESTDVFLISSNR
jgi:hypothetical protein